MSETSNDTAQRYKVEFTQRKALQSRDKRQTTRKYVLQLKTDSICFDCKQDYPHYILQFDHVKGEKIGDVGQLARLGDMEKLLEEIEKCEIVCANCHAHRTFMRSAGRPRQTK